MGRGPLRVAAAAVALFATGCACSDEARPAVVVDVQEPDGSPASTAVVTYTRDYGLEMTASVLDATPPATWRIGRELSGHYHVTATEGARTASVDVDVTRGLCHVDTRSVTITLPP